MWVKAYTRNNEGESSTAVYETTDISGPSPPKLINLTCKTQDTIFLHWSRPEIFYYSIDFYYIYVSLNNHLWKNITIPATKEHLDISVSSFWYFLP